MSEDQHRLGRPAEEDAFEAGQENSEIGNSRERQMEAQPGVFEAGQQRLLDSGEPEGRLESEQVDPDAAHLVDVSEDPLQTTVRDPRKAPKVNHPDPKDLEAQRVDQDDEVVARPVGPDFDREEAVLRKKTNNDSAYGEEK